MAISQEPIIYRSLADIRARKKALRAEINGQSGQISTQWHGLFVKPKEGQLPARRMSRLVSNGVSMFDAMLFAYKLYVRFSDGKDSYKRKRRRGKRSFFSLFL